MFRRACAFGLTALLVGIVFCLLPFPVQAGIYSFGKPADTTPYSTGLGTPNAGQQQSGQNNGQQAGYPNPAQAKAGEPVVMPTGNFFSTRVDIPGRSDWEALYFDRHYNSTRAKVKGALGFGWRHRWEIEYRADARGILVVWNDGREIRFTKTKDGFQPPSDVFEQLIKNPDGTFQLRTRENLLYRFDSRVHGQLTSIADSHGALVQLMYADSRPYRLQKVIDRYKNTLTFTCDGMGRLKEVADSAGRVAKYEHDVVRNLLVHATDPLGYAMEYRYDHDGNLAEQIFPDGVKLINKYDAMHRVVAQSGQGRADIFTFQYFDKERRVEARAWGGRLTQYSHDEKGRITEIVDPLGRRTINRYDARGLLTERVGPKGDRWRFRYDGMGNLIQLRTPLGFSWPA